ncbi:MAG TPA: hypothetical protein VIK53_17880 [Verrucomicrobiae bacterium]
MKTLIYYMAACVLLATFNLQLATAFAQGTTFTYNGRLNDQGPPATGSYDLSFTLYNAATNGTVFGALTNSATAVSNGLFMVTLDFGNVFNGSNYWLEIAARTNGGDAFSTLSPRQPVMPVPYAIYAANAGSAATANTAATAGIAASANSVAAANITGTVQLAQLPAAVVTNGSPFLSANPVSAASAGNGYMDYAQMPDGWNSWFYCGISINEEIVTNVLAQLKFYGLDKLGFTTLSLDGYDFTNRDANGIPMMDGTRFPHGFPWLCNYVHTNGFKIGVYGVVTNHAGMAGDPSDYYLFGAEDAGAAYFISNHVDYFKFDAPNGILNQYGVSVWPNEWDPITAQVVPAIFNPLDQSYLRFVMDLKQAPYPIFINSASTPDTNGNFPPNLPRLLTSWRMTGYSGFKDKLLGLSMNGDIAGPWSPLMLWSWVQGNRPLYERMNDYFYPDFDPEYGGLPADYQRHFYTCAFFGSIFQMGALLNPQAGYHNFTNEFASPVFRQIRARQTLPHFAYATNGCVICSKDNRSGGLDVLVLNENYNEFPDGDGFSVGSPVDRRGLFGFTNSLTYQSHNYALTFYATNAPLDFGVLGLSSANVIVTSAENGAQLYAATGFSPLVFAAAARLYTMSPVMNFPTPNNVVNGVRDLTLEPCFAYWTTNNYGSETAFGSFRGNPPAMGGPVQGMELQWESQTAWGINGAASFTTRAGVDDYADGIGSQPFFYVDGQLVMSPVFTSGYTNLTINFSPTNQTFSIYCGNIDCFFGNPQFNYPLAGNGAGLTNLSASAITGGITTNILTGGHTFYITNGVIMNVQ